MPDAQINKRKITVQEIIRAVDDKLCYIARPKKVYAVPKNGLICALIYNSYQQKENQINIITDPSEADVFLDDLIDSGATCMRYEKRYPGKPFVTLFNKKDYDGVWLEFPWEADEQPAGDAVVRIIEAIGEDPKREGLIETPARVIKSWQRLYGGYKQDPAQILSKVFSEKSDEMVLLKNIEIYSTCEHHMLPFFGRCHIAYIPNEKVVGISKLARLAECFARRLQIQERLTNQIAEAINKHLNPQGVGVIIEAQHFCMTSRGVEKQNSIMVTNALQGVFTEQHVKEEFINLCQ